MCSRLHAFRAVCWMLGIIVVRMSQIDRFVNLLHRANAVVMLKR